MSNKLETFEDRGMFVILAPAGPAVWLPELVLSDFLLPEKKKILTHLSLMEFQLDQSFSVLRAVVWYFSSNFNRTFCKQIVETLIRCSVLRHLIWETLIRCSVLRHLIWVCTICICPTRRTLCLYGLKPMAEMT